MLRKVLKHDLMPLVRPFIIASVSLILLSVLAGFSLRGLITYNMFADGGHFPSWLPFAVLGLTVSFLALVVYAVGLVIIVLVRFYQNFFTDEGYLTFTLPVRRYTLLNSKLLSAFITSAAGGIVIALSLVIALLIAPAKQDGTGIALISTLEFISDVFITLFGYTGVWLTLHIIFAVILAICASVFSTVMTFACVTVGCVLVKKNKALMAVLIYYIASSAISVASYGLSWVYELASTLMYADIIAFTPFVTLLLLIAYSGILAVLTTFIYRFMLSRIEKNLNLV